jgi:hypothetical protein
MVRWSCILLVAFAVAACSRSGDEQRSTPLPTRQTTIDPVNTKLEAAAQDAAKRKQDVDDAAK